MKNKRHQAIGVFDSGLGGLSVVKALRAKLPQEDIVYFGDTARVPYGTKSKEAIIRFSCENTKVLLKEDVKLVVVACNSSSSYAINTLTRKFKVPIIGVIKPGALRANEVTKNRRIGVIATSATIQSQQYNKSIKQLNTSNRVFTQACPLFVPLAEEGRFNGNITTAVAKEYLAALKAKKIDTLILGCTHYPLLKKVIARVMGGGVQLVDSAEVVALRVEKMLLDLNQQRTTKRQGKIKFIVSDKPQEFKKIAKNFLGYSINPTERINHV